MLWEILQMFEQLISTNGALQMFKDIRHLHELGNISHFRSSPPAQAPLPGAPL
ncbi:hypothetical protein [Acetobacter papayae]|uniref:hypothetical protein n=1 Tax=Acetobacter papayae TaxID=1076592 RepID=UPI0039EC0D9C